jgi:hypothetical protein
MFVSAHTSRRFLRWTSFSLVVAVPLGGHSCLAGSHVVEDLQQILDSLRAINNDFLVLETFEIYKLAKAIRYVTGSRLGNHEATRYAFLIYCSSQLYGTDPLEIIALIMAESSFESNSVNRSSGDYGLGQVNWKYWGKPNGLTPQELLDPAVNIVLTCHIYRYYGFDFAKYHNGDGKGNPGYIENLKSILSELRTFASGFK